MDKNAKIYVAGHTGMVGSAIVRKLKSEGYKNLILRTSSELDLRDSQSVKIFFQKELPEYVFLSAAKVGGINANNLMKGDFIYDNLMIQNNVIHLSKEFRVKKLLFLGSSCIYPKFADQPIKEDSLLTGLLEPSNEAYALAKIAGLKMCDFYREQYGCDFISLMPTNLYGPNDNYDLKNSHVIPALLMKMHTAMKLNSNTVEVWGSGKPKREFLHVDDLADACLYFMKHYSDFGTINIGSGEEKSIKNIVGLIKEIVGYEGGIYWNRSFPDGTPRKLLDTSKASQLGWKSSILLEDGLKRVYSEKFGDK